MDAFTRAVQGRKRGRGMTREQAINYLRSSGMSEEQINTVIDALSAKPSDDATLKDIFCMDCEYKNAEPKTGHWIEEDRYIDRYDGTIEILQCSLCGFKHHYCQGDTSLTDYTQFKYCPNCGARMARFQPRQKLQKGDTVITKISRSGISRGTKGVIVQVETMYKLISDFSNDYQAWYTAEELEEAKDEIGSDTVARAMKEVVPTYRDPEEINCHADRSDEMRAMKKKKHSS